MDTKDFYYELPAELIAQDPLEDRSSSRLLVLHKDTGEITHGKFTDIKKYLRPGDCLVINNTRVLPARLLGKKAGTGGAVEILLLKKVGDDLWEALAKPGKKAREGSLISFGEGRLTGRIERVLDDGNRIISFSYDKGENGTTVFEQILDELGQMPLPPYIKHELKDKDRYQTVYARYDGSAAAPTAGLHFTPALLKEIREGGVAVAEITLHVGLGTFRPVKTGNIEDHHMHSEYYNITQEAAELINSTREKGGRIVCVGTTSCRSVESAADENGRVLPKGGWTDIFIYPGYKFKVLDCLITNFHLPESTLLMLVSALAGRENVLSAYSAAIREKYRFYSFGDAMLII